MLSRSSTSGIPSFFRCFWFDSQWGASVLWFWVIWKQCICRYCCMLLFAQHETQQGPSHVCCYSESALLCCYKCRGKHCGPSVRASIMKGCALSINWCISFCFTYVLYLQDMLHELRAQPGLKLFILCCILQMSIRWDHFAVWLYTIVARGTRIGGGESLF